MTPERVCTFALDRLPESAYPSKLKGTAQANWSQRRAHLRGLTFQVRKNHELAQRRYRKSDDKEVNTVNKPRRVGEWIKVDTHAKDGEKLDQKVNGSYRILKRCSHRFTVLAKGLLRPSKQ